MSLLPNFTPLLSRCQSAPQRGHFAFDLTSKEHALASDGMHELGSESTADLDGEVALLAEGAWLWLGHRRIVA